MIVMGIETSCDETAAALVQDGRIVLANIIASQTDLHAPFGGVVPEMAARRHIEAIGYIVEQALMQAQLTLDEVDAFAVANGPGLAGALLVGLNYAKGLAFAKQKPLIGVHHIEGHVCANYLDMLDVNKGLTDSGTPAHLKGLTDKGAAHLLAPPFLSLVVSGGHTILLAVEDYRTYRVLGGTRDDAAGEAFDKIARILGLPFPGGPEVDKLAETGNAQAVAFPRAKVGELDFSFSGLKTAVSQFMAKNKTAKNPVPLADIAASFRQAVVDVLVNKTMLACHEHGYKQVALAGGVACNRGLRAGMQAACDANGIGLSMPPPIFCTDNGAMIASRGYYELMAGQTAGWGLNAYPGRMV